MAANVTIHINTNSIRGSREAGFYLTRDNAREFAL